MVTRLWPAWCVYAALNNARKSHSNNTKRGQIAQWIKAAIEKVGSCFVSSSDKTLFPLRQQWRTSTTHFRIRPKNCQFDSFYFKQQNPPDWWSNVHLSSWFNILMITQHWFERWASWRESCFSLHAVQPDSICVTCSKEPKMVRCLTVKSFETILQRNQRIVVIKTWGVGGYMCRKVYK